MQPTLTKTNGPDEEHVPFLGDGDAGASGKRSSRDERVNVSIRSSRWLPRLARNVSDVKRIRSRKAAVVLAVGAAILLVSFAVLGIRWHACMTSPQSTHGESGQLGHDSSSDIGNRPANGRRRPRRRFTLSDHTFLHMAWGGPDGPAVVSNIQCQQVEPLVPSSGPDLELVYSTHYDHSNTDATSDMAENLAGMVRINTEAFDDTNSPPPSEPEDDDPRRLGLYALREYLAATWPTLHEKLPLEIINRYSLLYTWEGSDPSLKPLMLAAHLDTVPVPVETLDRWTYPPFSGVIANGRVWGRGSVDCKSQVTALMDSVDTLASSDFEPRRTVILAFGHDEEISGSHGAAVIARHLESKYGRSSIELILDEGSGVVESNGYYFVNPVVSDLDWCSGNLTDLPEHMGIKKLARVIIGREEHPFAPTPGLNKEMEPILVDTLHCAAEYHSLDPSPVPFPTSAAFRVFAGTARHTLARPTEPFYVVPYRSTGNNSSKHYHGLSANVLRFSPVRNDRDFRGVHLVNENADVLDLLPAAGFFFTLIRNMDELAP
ncbi:hypothetical protein HK405_008044 [Cladochytrium tenue]|nr:hypothetical protein HK405_008044 [Cladochytrium tenue]